MSLKAAFNYEKYKYIITKRNKMKIEIVVNERIERLYTEYMALIEELRQKTKEERFKLYNGMTKTLIPHAKKMVKLED